MLLQKDRILSTDSINKSNSYNTFFSRCVVGLLFALFLAILFPSFSYAERPKLMGKIEFKGKIDTIPQWVEVLKRNAQRPIFADNSMLNANTKWGDLKPKLLALSKRDQIEQVNRFWNQWPYRLDDAAYRLPDYWAAPYQFRETSGDCEDYSIAKYFTLKELGFSPDDMRIVIVRETIRNIAHAVLAVYIDDEIYILDNMSNKVLPHTAVRNYDAQYAVNEKFRWGLVSPKK